MPWDAVVVAVSRGHNTKELQNELKLLEELKILKTDELLFVEDACGDAGSAGSVLNALLITAERLSAKAGYSVLSEDVFDSSAVLILLIGPKRGAFHAVTSPREWTLLPDTVIVRQMRNLEMFRASEKKGLWICGTDSCFSTKPTPLVLSTSAISVFSFPWQTDTLHGSYQVDSLNRIKGIEYPSARPEPSPLVLSLLYIPPSVVTVILSLHSRYPLSASTYYGADTGTLGLKLSLFFDLLLATCLERGVYLNNEVGEEKIDRQQALRHDARLIIWERLHRVDSVLVAIEADDYHYFTDELDLHGQTALWVESLCSRLFSSIVNRSSRIETLPSLIALDRIGLKLGGKLMEVVLRVCEQEPAAVSRALYVCSDFLFLLANGKGGLRMGPAANTAFAEVFTKLRERDNWVEDVGTLLEIIREDWMEDEHKLVRGARHLEAAAQIIYGKRTLSLRPVVEVPTFRGGQGVRVQCAARVDIFGGWLDTPPITYETSPSAVINLAVSVDGQLPLSCEVALSSSPGITFSAEGRTVAFSSVEQIRSTACRPSDHGALLCACLVSIGLLDTSSSLETILLGFYGSAGVLVMCSSALPHGSGLGTSSILACGIISALLGEIPSKDDLVHLVLCVEHTLTSGGGWQDQVGGIYGGIKIGEFNGRVEVRHIPIQETFRSEINQRLVLVYTGKTRLAKNLLQEVIRNWYAGGETVQFMSLMQEALSNCENKLANGEFPVDEVQLYYEVKKKLATGCEPALVTNVVRKLKSENICDAAWIAGAGGGGFLYLWLAKGKTVKHLNNSLQDVKMTGHVIQICENPLVIHNL